MNKILMKLLHSITTLAVVSMMSGAALAEDWSKLSAKKQTKLGLYMTPQEAFDHVQKNMSKTLFVDTRTQAELVYLGAPPSIDANVPYEFMDETKWDDKKSVYDHYDNKNFVADIDARMKKKGLKKDATVILMCRSGNRSAKAADLLAKAGYTKVYNQVEGFEGDKAKDGDTKGKRTVNGWKNAGLPWNYHLDKEVMYFKK